MLNFNNTRLTKRVEQLMEWLSPRSLVSSVRTMRRNPNPHPNRPSRARPLARLHLRSRPCGSGLAAFASWCHGSHASAASPNPVASPQQTLRAALDLRHATTPPSSLTSPRYLGPSLRDCDSRTWDRAAATEVESMKKKGGQAWFGGWSGSKTELTKAIIGYYMLPYATMCHCMLAYELGGWLEDGARQSIAWRCRRSSPV